MGFRFQRSMKLLPGVRLNFSKSGIGASFGVRGARYSVSPTGRRTVSAGIPGSGLSWRQSEGGSVRRPSLGSSETYAQRITEPRGVGCFPIGFLFIGALGIISAFSAQPVDLGVLLVWACVAAPAALLIAQRIRAQRAHTGIEDERAHEGSAAAEASNEIPETLDEIVEEQRIYTPMWEAYRQAKSGRGGGTVNGRQLDDDEVSLYELAGEFFDPARGLEGIQGDVIVTNKRIIFDSVERNHEWPLAKFTKLTITGAGQRVFTIKGRSRNHGLLFTTDVNHFDNALGLALALTNPKLTPGAPETLFEEYLTKLAVRRAELESSISD